VTRGRLPQRADSPDLNGTGAAAAVPLKNYYMPQKPVDATPTRSSLSQQVYKLEG